MSLLALPYPNDKVSAGIVIASTWLQDDEEFGLPFALVLVLRPEPCYYGLYEITQKQQTWEWVEIGRYPNINPAVEAYSENGGDY